MGGSEIMARKLFNIAFNKDHNYKLYYRDNDKKIIENGSYHSFFYIDYNSFISKEEKIRNEVLKELANCGCRFISKVESVNVGIVLKYSKSWPYKLGNLSRFLYSKSIIFYEMDIDAKKQLLSRELRNVSLGDDKLKILYFDIETDDSQPLQTREDGKVRGVMSILCFAAMDDEGNKYYYDINKFDEEPALLNNLRLLLSKYDVLITWNGDRFDIPIVKERFEKFNIAFDWDSVISLDYMWLYKKNSWGSRESYSLRNIALYEGVSEKLSLDNRKVLDLWQNDKKILKQYNLRDVEILKQLEDKLMFIKLHEIQANIAHCTLTSTVYVGELIDCLILYNSPKNFIFNNVNSGNSIIHESYAGGYTFCLKRGVFNDVVIFDFTGLYLSVMVSWNMSKYTKLNNKQDDCYESFSDEYNNKFYSSHYFSKEDGIIKNVLVKLKEERDKIKRIKDYKLNKGLFLTEQAIKTVGNSIYGVHGDNKKRYYDIDVANSITATARQLTKRAVKWLEDEGYAVVGGDTDSFFVSGVDENYVQELLNKLNEYIKSIAPLNNIVSIGVVGYYKNFMMINKKNYAYCNSIEDIKIKGLKAIKIDFCKAGAAMQKNIIKYIFEGHDLNYIINELLKFRDFVIGGNLVKDDLIITQGVSKNFNEYGGENKSGGDIPVPLHVRLAMEDKNKNNAHFYIGKKYSLIITKRNGDGKLDGKLVNDWTEENGYYALHYWNDYILENCLLILKIVFGNSYDWDSLYIDKDTYRKTVENESLSKYY